MSNPNPKNKIFHITSTFKSTSESDGSVVIRGMASTDDVDRVGDIIPAEAWAKGGLNNFKSNPIILFNHNYDKPIGRANSISVVKNGLELEAKISKFASDGVAELIKENILGAFSVGFLIKDVDYIAETDGFMIKDAELLEVSVVSVPCNQAATFSLVKSFDSLEEYEDFKKTFTNRVDLAGQLLAKEEAKASKLARNTSEAGTEVPNRRSKMGDETVTPGIDLDAVALKAAEKAAQVMTATFEANRKAEKDAAEAARKAAEDEKARKESLEATIAGMVTAGMSGAEKLIKDMQDQLTKKDTDMNETIKRFQSELEERSREISLIRDSKGRFFDRGTSSSTIEKYGVDIMHAHMLGVMTKKGWNTDFARALAQKAGIDYTVSAQDIDQEVARQIEKEIQSNLRVAKLFREIKVNGAATVLPIQPDTGLAEWAINATAGNLENRESPTANTYTPKQVILNAFRLVSSTYMDNDTDEQVLINLMPMLVEGVARAHARTVERMCLLGDEKSNANIVGLDSYAAAFGTEVDLDEDSVGANLADLTADLLLGARQSMGKYGINPSDLAYIVSQQGYYDLLSDPKFQTLDEVGNELAVRVTGSLGAVYGTPVIVSDEFAAPTAGAALAFAVYTRNYVIPRLRNVLVEQDYEVMNQRRVIVASQSLGFEEILPGNGSTYEPSVKIVYTA